MAEHVVLPTNIRLKYLNEGAANIVYNICFAPNLINSSNETTVSNKFKSLGLKAGNSIYADKLLRLRKNLPTTCQVCVSHSHWLNHIAPLFCPDEIVQQSLVAIKASGIISCLNAELQEWEQSANRIEIKERSENRRGTYLADEEFGLLVTDMTPQTNTILVEFKPKWLTQSLSAPSKSTRCRQCALRAFVNADSRNLEELLPSQRVYCPLDLLSNDRKVIFDLARSLLPPQADPIYVQCFVEWIQNSSLLRRLRELQMQFDRTGTLDLDPLDRKFLIAMTIRDCTVFLRISKNGEKIEARIGDLDLKSTAKISYWKQIENELINGGWYEGAEDKSHQQPNYCVLGRNRQTV
ncbi:Inositol-pentakisphosphate 2-kinase [Erysiphe neolycopersici]|uniref:Inositol-pentakisphosphate 2-kinase n=1 Tax=Erysiphe neolycopersici TaxID=212602 RepID=A0A420HKT4_9PEZI|nr:Inositol-pentakisphosphate 2-kinase [Erysiphe neolycopersici]